MKCPLGCKKNFPSNKDVLRHMLSSGPHHDKRDLAMRLLKSEEQINLLKTGMIKFMGQVNSSPSLPYIELLEHG
jgi:hypothetical protein